MTRAGDKTPPHPLRAEVREFLAARLAGMSAPARARTWMGFDPEFSRAMGARGWIGMCWPARYGGHERSALERYVVLEEVLAAGAPVAAHWVADRQSGPLLLRYGTEPQRREFLPAMARGELYFCIGMSEPDSGSDLAAVRTRAVPVAGGYCVNGAKLWTSHAHRAHWMIALFRTAEGGARQAGLSQFLVDMKSPGIGVRPIRDITGESHFNEVTFTDVFVPEDKRVGPQNAGWKQVRAELAFERSGPERYLSSYLLLAQLLQACAMGRARDGAPAVLGNRVAHLAVLRQMSLSVAGMLEAGQNPDLMAAMIKDLGTGLEQSLPEMAADVVDVEPCPGGPGAGDDPLAQVLGYLTQAAPSFSLRGGTREILRGIIARGLGLR